jgi:hypothetical protein
MVDYGFAMWTHMQTPLEVSSIEDRVCVAEAEVAQKKRDLASLSFGKHAIAMLSIVAKTEEITIARVEQDSMFEMITYAVDKALFMFTQLSNVQFDVNPLNEKINTTDLKTSQVTTVQDENVVQLRHDL